MKIDFNRSRVLTKTDFIINRFSISAANLRAHPSLAFNSRGRSSDAGRMDAIRLFLLVFLIAMAGLYLLHCHALASIARKTGQGVLMEVLAWLPGLQLIPTLRVGGVGFGRFCLHLLGFCLAAGAIGGVSSLLAGGQGGFLLAVGVGLLSLLACLYIFWIQWQTAAARDLPGWLGPLASVPLFGLAVYPIIAFHDGWSRPHPLGGFIGALTAVAMLAPATMPLDAVESSDGLPTSLAQWTRAAGFEGLGEPDAAEDVAVQIDASGVSPGAAAPARPPAETAEASEDHEKAIRALFDLQGRFATLVALADPDNMRDPDNRSRALRLVASIRAELEGRRTDLDGETYDRLAGDLVRIEGQIQGRAAPRSTASGSFRSADAGRRLAAKGAAQPAAIADGDGAPLRPFPVTAAEDCPPGTELRSRTGEKGEEEWCRQLAQYGGLRHGWYVRYFENGRPEQVGEYRDGLRVGVWTRFYASGAVRAQAEFRGGLQHGWLLSFDEQGERQQALRFQQGVALR